MAEPMPNKDALLDAALTLAGEKGWAELTLPMVAERCACPEAELRRQFRNKRTLLDALVERFEQQAEESVDDEARDPDLPVPERLFDVLMTRLELLQEHRAGYIAILEHARRDPCMAIGGAARLYPAMGSALHLAGLSARGPCGLVKRKVLGVLYLSVINVWVQDESEDLGRTMATLDKRLRQLDEIVSSTRIGRSNPLGDKAKSTR